MPNYLSSILDYFRIQAFYRKPAAFVAGDQVSGPDVLDLISVAFNKPEMIRYQHQLLQKFLTDRHRYIVGDNSTDAHARNSIRTYCAEHGITYIGLPPTPVRSSQFSRSHGAALNYLYRNVVKPQGNRFFGFLDHDIFPMRPVSLTRLLKEQPFYGMLQEFPYPSVPGGLSLYLWPGLAIFDATYTCDKHLDFMASRYGDTGSACFPTVYKPLLIDAQKKDCFLFADEKRIPFQEGDDFQNDMYAIIGNDWLHVVNASDWHPSADPSVKGVFMNRLIEKLLSEN